MVKLLKFESWFQDMCWWFVIGMQFLAMLFKLDNWTKAPGSEDWRDAACKLDTSNICVVKDRETIMKEAPTQSILEVCAFRCKTCKEWKVATDVPRVTRVPCNDMSWQSKRFFLQPYTSFESRLLLLIMQPTWCFLPIVIAVLLSIGNDGKKKTECWYNWDASTVKFYCTQWRNASHTASRVQHPPRCLTDLIWSFGSAKLDSISHQAAAR